MVDDRRVSLISFTGSCEIGKQVGTKVNHFVILPVLGLIQQSVNNSCVFFKTPFKGKLFAVRRVREG